MSVRGDLQDDAGWRMTRRGREAVSSYLAAAGRGWALARFLPDLLFLKCEIRVAVVPATRGTVWPG